jgi:hypothetical protein
VLTKTAVFFKRQRGAELAHLNISLPSHQPKTHRQIYKGVVNPQITEKVVSTKQHIQRGNRRTQHKKLHSTDHQSAPQLSSMLANFTRAEVRPPNLLQLHRLVCYPLTTWESSLTGWGLRVVENNLNKVLSEMTIPLRAEGNTKRSTSGHRRPPSNALRGEESSKEGGPDKGKLSPPDIRFGINQQGERRRSRGANNEHLGSHEGSNQVTMQRFCKPPHAPVATLSLHGRKQHRDRAYSKQRRTPGWKQATPKPLNCAR